MEDLWEGDAERMRRVPSEGEWSCRREDMRVWRESPDDSTTSPPFGSSRRSEIMCSWNRTMSSSPPPSSS